MLKICYVARDVVRAMCIVGTRATSCSTKRKVCSCRMLPRFTEARKHASSCAPEISLSSGLPSCSKIQPRLASVIAVGGIWP